MRTFFTTLRISATFWVLWALFIPWFVVSLNRRFSTSPRVRRFMVPQPSRLILQRWMRQRPTPYQEREE